MGSKRAVAWLQIENGHAPKEDSTISLVEVIVLVPVSRHLDQDNHGGRVDTSSRDMHDWGDKKDDFEG